MAECLYVFYKPSVMKDLKHVIGLVSLFVVVYHSAPFIGIPAEVIALMFVLSPFVVLWMVYSILKHGKPSGIHLTNVSMTIGIMNATARKKRMPDR